MLQLTNQRQQLIESALLPGSPIASFGNSKAADIRRLQEKVGPLLSDDSNLSIESLVSAVSELSIMVGSNLTQFLNNISSDSCGFDLACLQGKNSDRLSVLVSYPDIQQLEYIQKSYFSRLMSCWVDCSTLVEITSDAGAHLKLLRVADITRLQQLRLWYCRTAECVQVVNTTVEVMRGRIYEAWASAIVPFTYPIVDRIICLCGILGSSFVIIGVFVLLALGIRWATFKSAFWLTLLGIVLVANVTRLVMWGLLLNDKSVSIFEPDHTFASTSVLVSWAVTLVLTLIVLLLLALWTNLVHSDLFQFKHSGLVLLLVRIALALTIAGLVAGFIAANVFYSQSSMLEIRPDSARFRLTGKMLRPKNASMAAMVSFSVVAVVASGALVVYQALAFGRLKGQLTSELDLVRLRSVRIRRVASVCVLMSHFATGEMERCVLEHYFCRFRDSTSHRHFAAFVAEFLLAGIQLFAANGDCRICIQLLHLGHDVCVMARQLSDCHKTDDTETLAPGRG